MLPGCNGIASNSSAIYEEAEGYEAQAGNGCICLASEKLHVICCGVVKGKTRTTHTTFQICLGCGRRLGNNS